MIIRVKKTNKYTVISNSVANNPEISLKAKGLYYYLMTKPDTWEISREGIKSQVKEGRDAIAAALDELKDTGYFVSEQVRNENGQFSTVNTLYEEPQRENRNGKTVTENQPQVNTEIVNTESNHNTITNVIGEEASQQEEPKEKPRRDNTQITEVLQHFEIQFNIKLKQPAIQRQQAFNLIRRYTFETVLQGISAAALIRNERYAPMILDLKDLWFKWDKVEAFYKRKQQEQTKVAIITDD